MATEKPVLIAKSRDRMPNHLFYATVRHFDKKNAVARKVLCELYLPDSHRGEIEIIFHPTAEQIPAFQFVPAVSLYARSQPARFVLRSDEIWHEGAQTGMQDGISFMYSCKGRASNLEIRNLLGQSKSNTLKAGTFWLTECPLINTAMTVMHSYTGNVRAKQIVKPTFTLSTGVRLALVPQVRAPVLGANLGEGKSEALLQSSFCSRSRAVHSDSITTIAISRNP